LLKTLKLSEIALETKINKLFEELRKLIASKNLFPPVEN
jgi:hypothetical protein